MCEVITLPRCDRPWDAYDAMISIRPARRDDAEQLLAWRNDDATRHASLIQEQVQVSEHEAWLDRVLADENRFLFIAMDGPDAVGTARFDLEGQQAEVSINLNPDFRGRGLAQDVLRECIVRFRSDLGRAVELTAIIRPTNSASVRLFASQGFIRVDSSSEVDNWVLRTDPS